MKFAYRAPWRFIAANAFGVAAVWTITVSAFITTGITDVPRLTLLAVGTLGTLWIALMIFFFRDPERAPGLGVLSPADGRVTSAEELGGSFRLSIFLSLFDVHVIRAPIAGEVMTIDHHHGGKRFAFSKESRHNERVVLEIWGEAERAVLTLIAGAFADRIVSYVEKGARLQRGERIGIIKFGSRVDLKYQSERPHRLAVKPGNTVIAGQSSVIVSEGEARPT